MYHLWKYVYGARKSKSMLRPCVSVLNLRIRACSCVNLSSLLEKSPFNLLLLLIICIYIHIYMYILSLLKHHTTTH